MGLKLHHISKGFPGVQALDDVSWSVEAGEVHALCGENGAGKSTLMNIIAGHVQPDSGTIEWNGVTLAFGAGIRSIAIVYQHLSLIESLNIAENIFANDPPRNRWGFIQYDLLFSEARKLLNKLRIDLNPATRVSRLSAAQKQMIEIAKALARNPQLLILDEPTASLTDHEVEILFGIIHQLKSANVAVIYISHRLNEIFNLADRITVLKDGKHQGTFNANAITRDALIQKMVGREIQELRMKSFATDEVLLETSNFSGKGFSGISFQLHKGEIVGLAGLAGAGRTEIARAIIGMDEWTGDLLVHGRHVAITHPADAMAYRIAYVPEERKSAGLFMELSIQDNIIAAKLNDGNSVWYDARGAAKVAEHYRNRLRISSTALRQPVDKLSGGNQQKVVLSKWLATDPDILLVDEPTHGVDIGAKFEIYEILKNLTESGKGILLISSELTELLGLCDRILVVRQGEIVGALSSHEATEEKIVGLASGT